MTPSQLRTRVCVLACAIVLQATYILFPFDLIPDLLPLVGWIDDLVAFGSLLVSVGALVRALNNGGARALLEWMEPTQPEVDYEPIPPEILREL